MFRIVLAASILLALAMPANAAPQVERKTCVSNDGVTIVYSAAGKGNTALVFIPGAMANRSFFDGQLRAFSNRYRVIAIDLGGHGESGTNRKTWGVREFAGDVKAVVDAEKLQRVILFGNSLGGPVAIEAALLLPGRVLGVVGIDTFQDVGHPDTPEYRQEATAWARKRAEAFRTDFPGAMKTMIKMLFHPDADPSLMADVERRMMATSPEVASGMMTAIADYDPNPAGRKLTVPLRAINGDLFPTDVQAARKVKPDFDAVVMKHMGHYPMLERPEEFDRHVAEVVRALDSRK